MATILLLLVSVDLFIYALSVLMSVHGQLLAV
jgi:hypothetical protein